MKLVTTNMWPYRGVGGKAPLSENPHRNNLKPKTNPKTTLISHDPIGRGTCS